MISCSLINKFLSRAILLVLFLAVAIRWCCSFAVSLRKRLWEEIPIAVVKQTGNQLGLRSVCVGAVALGLLNTFLLWRAFFRFPGEVGRAVLIEIFRADIEPGRLFLSAVWSGSFWCRLNNRNWEETYIISFLPLHLETLY